MYRRTASLAIALLVLMAGEAFAAKEPPPPSEQYYSESPDVVYAATERVVLRYFRQVNGSPLAGVQVFRGSLSSLTCSGMLFEATATIDPHGQSSRVQLEVRPIGAEGCALVALKGGNGLRDKFARIFWSRLDALVTPRTP